MLKIVLTCTRMTVTLSLLYWITYTPSSTMLWRGIVTTSSSHLHTSSTCFRASTVATPPSPITVHWNLKDRRDTQNKSFTAKHFQGCTVPLQSTYLNTYLYRAVYCSSSVLLHRQSTFVPCSEEKDCYTHVSLFVYLLHMFLCKYHNCSTFPNYHLLELER